MRDAATSALKNRADALPWLRRAVRSTDKDTAKRAAALLEPHEKKRQETVSKAIDACIRDGHIDLVMEWHHYWQPEKKDDLWSVVAQASKPGMELFAKVQSPETAAAFEQRSRHIPAPPVFYDGPQSERPKRLKPLPGVKGNGVWLARLDGIDMWSGPFRFASVDGPIKLHLHEAGHFFTLGSVQAPYPNSAFHVCDGDFFTSWNSVRGRGSTKIGLSMIVCRGNCSAMDAIASVILADGDIDLVAAKPEFENCLFRATGEIRFPPTAVMKNCKIEANVKNATAPYKFFEIRDVGLSATVDAKECAVANLTAIGTAGLQLSMSPTRAVYDLIVTDAKADTPIGNCGLAKGDRIHAIDDVRFTSADDFRKKLRRAMVRQGDCLLTIIRDGKVLDLPVFFPMPK